MPDGIPTGCEITLGDYTVDAIHSLDGLLALEQEWAALLEESVVDNLYLTWDWVTTWWRLYGGDKQLWLLRARQAKDGGLIGLAPLALMYESSPLGTWRILSFIGTWDSDHLDFIIRAGKEVPVAGAFVEYLRTRRDEWDFVDLISLNADSPSLGGLLMGETWYTRWPLQCPYIKLADTWEDYTRQLSRRSRRNLRQYGRYLQEDNLDQDISYHVARDLMEGEKTFEALLDFMYNHWSAQKKSLTGYQDRAHFLRSVAGMNSSRGHTRLYNLCVGDQIIAADLAFTYSDVIYLYRTAYDAKWADYSPGVLLLRFVVLNALEDGFQQIDLGLGATEHKVRWSTDTRMDLHIRTAMRPGPRLLLESIPAGRGVWNVIRRTLPEGARETIKRALGYGLPGIDDRYSDPFDE